MTYLVFLGTGGGRFATIFQPRRTGGIYLLSELPGFRKSDKEKGLDFSSDDYLRIHIDPGPGALFHLNELGINPTMTDAIFLSHAHIDHCGDAEILIEAMTHGGIKKRGLLFASASCINPSSSIGPTIPSYHIGLVQDVIEAKEGTSFNIGPLTVKSIENIHSDSTCVSFRISAPEGVIGIITDTAFSQKLIEMFKGTRLLIASVTRPRGMPIQHHLSTEDLVPLVNGIKPKLTILTHLGLKMLRKGPEAEAQWLAENTKCRVIAAKDGMVVEFASESINISHLKSTKEERDKK